MSRRPAASFTRLCRAKPIFRYNISLGAGRDSNATGKAGLSTDRASFLLCRSAGASPSKQEDIPMGKIDPVDCFLDLVVAAYGSLCFALDQDELDPLPDDDENLLGRALPGHEIAPGKRIACVYGGEPQSRVAHVMERLQADERIKAAYQRARGHVRNGDVSRVDAVYESYCSVVERALAAKSPPEVRERFMAAVGSLKQVHSSENYSEQKPRPEEAPLLAITLDPPTATLGGIVFPLEPDGAEFVHGLLKADGDWLTGPRNFPNIPRPDRVRRDLPEQIRSLVESGGSRGYRIARATLAALRQK
jgi:hypothetical protein